MHYSACAYPYSSEIAFQLAVFRGTTSPKLMAQFVGAAVFECFAD